MEGLEQTQSTLAMDGIPSLVVMDATLLKYMMVVMSYGSGIVRALRLVTKKSLSMELEMTLKILQ